MDKDAHSFTLTYHHGDVSNPLNASGNVVTTSSVVINQVQGRIGLPHRLNDRLIRLDLAGRLQDDQSRPDRGFLATVEARLSLAL